MIFKNFKKQKKGQLPTLETIGVLFIFFILVFFGIIFYSKFQEVNFKQKQTELVAKRAMDTTLKILFLPELQCSRGEAEPLDNCIDIKKLEALQTLMDDHGNDYYFNLFSFSKISVHEAYPLTKPAREPWVLYNKEKPEWTAKEPTFFVVALKDEVDPLYADEAETKFSYGYVQVEVYS